jgi:hypothetical protein
LYVRDATVTNTSGRGIDAEQGCAKLYVDRVRVNNTSRYGILVGLTGSTITQYRIVNTAVVSSGGMAAGEEHGVYFGSKSSTTGFFGFNTITGNYRGVGCQASRTLTNSIVAGNTLTQVDVCTANAANVVTDNSKVDLVTGLDPKLQNTAKNDACCVDKAAAPTQTDTPVPTDYFMGDRPMGKGYDIGYHELK